VVKVNVTSKTRKNTQTIAFTYVSIGFFLPLGLLVAVQWSSWIVMVNGAAEGQSLLLLDVWAIVDDDDYVGSC
jgi:hypothetical protein